MPQEANTNAFNLAFDRFMQDGFFELNNSSIHLGHLYRLQTYLSDKRNPEISPYQFHLNQVYLIPEYVTEEVIAGAIKEHEHIIGTNHFNRPIDVCLVSMLTPSGRSNLQLSPGNQTQEFNSQKIYFERALAELLTLPSTWDSIQLNNAYFSNGNKEYPLSFNFSKNLLNNLGENEKN